MTRSDLLLTMVRAATQGDQVLLRRTIEAIAAEERAKNHHQLADRLHEFLNVNDNGVGKRGPDRSGQRFQSLLFETIPQREFSEIILPIAVRTACE